MRLLPLIVAFLLVTSTDAAEGKRFALLVGVDVYQHVKLEDLHYAERDVTELRDVLSKAGFQVALLTTAEGKSDATKAPTKANIEAALHRLLSAAGNQDVVLVGFAGRGYKCKFCPIDADMEAETNLLPLDDVSRTLNQSGAGKKMLFVDAQHRNDRLWADMYQAPKDAKNFIAVLSLDSNETKRAGGGHGVFFHHLLEGLRGKAANPNGNVTCDSLTAYLEREIPKFTEKWIHTSVFGHGYIRIVRSDGQEPAVLSKASKGVDLERYSNRAFSVLGPKDWPRESGGIDNHLWVEFTDKGTSIRVYDDSSGVADILAGPDRGIKMADRTKESVHEIHLAKKEVMEEDFENYKEEPPVPFDCKLGIGRWSEFSGTQGAVFKTKIRGVRATVQSKTKTIVLRCTCPEEKWESLKPAFIKIVTSLEPGKKSP